jgi:PBP1b-binding outer membrane lipoprotein LpoB
MKKIAMLVIGIAFLSACKKDYTCECTTNPGNTIEKYTIKDVSKARAKANCVSMSQDVGGTRYEKSCTLK